MVARFGHRSARRFSRGVDIGRESAKRGHPVESSEEEAVAVSVQTGSGHRLEERPSISVVTAFDA